MTNLSVRNYSVVFFLLVIGFLSSCCRNVDCTRGFTTVSFVQFMPPDLDSFYLRRYKINTNFSVKLDTVIYKIRQNIFYKEHKRDTSVVQPADLSTIPKLFFIEEGYDYELVLPSIGKISRITDVEEGNEEQNICGMARRQCYTQIRTVKVDGILHRGSVIVKK